MRVHFLAHAWRRVCGYTSSDYKIDCMCVCVCHTQDVLSRIPRSGPDSGDTGPLTRTGDATRGRDQQDAHSKELAAMRAQVEQLAAERELLEKAHSNEVCGLVRPPGMCTHTHTHARARACI